MDSLIGSLYKYQPVRLFLYILAITCARFEPWPFALEPSTPP